MRSEEQLLGTLEELTDRIRTEVARGVSLAPDNVAAESTPSATHLAHLVDGVRALDDAASLSEILDALVRLAAREASDVRLVLAGDGGAGAAREWRPSRVALQPGKAAADRTTDTDRLVTEAVASGHVVSHGQSIAVPVLLAGQVVAVLRASRDTGPGEIDQSDNRRWQTVIEILARHAARCLEAVIAFKTARFVSRTAGSPTARAGDEAQAARRYARLLISEIRLYHEAAIVEGQRQRNLVSRLAGEIARAQALYDERVPDEVRRTTDYFRAELVRTLANGDASLLASWRSGSGT